MRAYNTYMHKSGFGQNPDENAKRGVILVQPKGAYQRRVFRFVFARCGCCKALRTVLYQASLTSAPTITLVVVVFGSMPQDVPVAGHSVA